MLSFFRRLVNSRVGVIVTLVVLVLIALAFAAGDVSGLRTRGMSALSGNNVASVGGQSLGVADLRQQVETEVEGLRQQQPTLTMPAFLAQGGLEGTFERMVTGLALVRFAGDQGMVAGKRLVDGQLASIPGLQAANGTFDMAVYQRLLAERHLTDAKVRSEIAEQVLTDQLTVPTVGASQVPDHLITPYAGLLLEKRSGEVAFVPAASMAAGPAPSDADLQAFYRRDIARYTLPQRRVMRYAVVTPATVKASATPTDAEIAAAYNADRATYQPTEKRTIDSVVAGDQATAAAIAAKVRAGTSLADAARVAGLESSSQDVDRAAYATATSPAVAQAVFAAAKGALVGPVRAPLGFIVARVSAVTAVPGKSLAQAHDAIAADLTQRKTLTELGRLHDAIDDALGKNATFDEVAKDQHLAALATPALTATGADPAQPDAKPDPQLAAVASAGFQADEGDAPLLVPVGQDGSFAVVALDRIVPPAPQPFAAVRGQLVKDVVADRARLAARRVAGAILAKANGGASLAQAVAGAGVALPAPRPLAATRAQLSANPRAVPPALALMFSMARGSTRLLETPDGAGWLVVRLQQIEHPDPAGHPDVIAATRSDLARLIGREYVEQFAHAVRAQVGVKTDPQALARLKTDLAGSGSDNP